VIIASLPYCQRVNDLEFRKFQLSVATLFLLGYHNLAAVSQTSKTSFLARSNVMSGIENRSTLTAMRSSQIVASSQAKQSCGVHARKVQQWENVLVEEIEAFPGQEQYESTTAHTICVSLILLRRICFR
jgi:hypothetical protein